MKAYKHSKQNDEAWRKHAYAKLAIGKKQLGWDDEYYYGIWLPQHGATKKDDRYSASTMDEKQLAAALREMERLGARFERPKRAQIGRPKGVERRPLLQKIEALLADAQRPWTYMTAVAKRNIKKSRNRAYDTPRGSNAEVSLLERLTGKQKLEFCSDAELGKVAAALEYDKARRQKQ